MSEAAWLAEFPREWREFRADFLCKPYRRTVSPEQFAGQTVAHYSIPAVQETGGSLLEPADDIDSAKLLIERPTILVSKLNPRKATICVAEPQAGLPTLASGEFISIQSSEFEQRYGFYVWSSQKVVDRLSAIVQSATRSHQRVTPDEILKLPWRWPPLETQRRIAAFLDDKTARIDALIARKGALLERLAEKRQAIITHAVTKGLDPAAPMKDSGVDWLGQIPAHWEVVPLRRMASRVVTGRTPPTAAGDYFADGDVPWFTPGDFSEGIVLENSEQKLTREAFDEDLVTLYPADSILLVGIGATLGKVAVAPVECSSNQQINAILPRRGSCPAYVAYFLRAFRQQVRLTASGNTLLILNQEKTKSLPFLRPSEAEQSAIAEHLLAADLRIKHESGRIQRSINLIQEYRSALITAAVTGQIGGLN